jgi:hypothetical protein
MIEYPFRTFETRDKPLPAWNPKIGYSFDLRHVRCRRLLILTFVGQDIPLVTVVQGFS